jgi:competence protein ComEC
LPQAKLIAIAFSLGILIMRLLHVLALLAGCCAGVYQHQLQTPGIIQVLLAIAALLGLGGRLIAKAMGDRRRWLIVSCLSVSVSLLGYCYANYCASARLASRLIDVPERGLEFNLCARIVELPKRSDRLTRLALDVIPTQSDARLRHVRHLRVGYYGEQMLHAGESWCMRAKLRAVHGEINPAGFDFERTAAAVGIDAIGYVQELYHRQLAARGIDALREDLSRRIATLLPAGPERALIQALAVGDTRQLSEADWQLMREQGMTHLIAISGLHITLFASLAAWLCFGICWIFPKLTRRIPRVQLSAMVGLIAASAYALLAGFGVPAQRTLLMLAVVMLAIIFRRINSIWSGFALALFSVLLFDPLVVMNAGAWMSFSAVALLILFFGKRFPRPGWFKEMLLAQALMTFGLLPLGVVFFGQISLTAPLANLIAIPVVSLMIVPLCLASVCLLLLQQAALATPLLQLAAWMWQALLAYLRILEHDYAQVYLINPSSFALLLATLAVLLLFAPLKWRYRALSLTLAAPLFMPHAPPAIANGQFEVQTFDVGQGLSVLVRTERNSLLFDTGPGQPEGANAGERLIVPSLRALGLRSLDKLVLSHHDLDHSGGYADIANAFAHQLMTSAQAEYPIASPCMAGLSWRWDNVEFRFLHPNEGLPYLRNQSSCVLKIQSLKIANHSALLPGDIDQLIEERLLRTQSAHLKASLLIAPHHGSNGSSGSQFLAAVGALDVIFPVGYANRFDFPRPEALARMRAVGAKLHATDEMGAISAKWNLQSDRFELSGERERQRRWWHVH